ncbi:hypothetical protein F4778DRAFT_783982 [Xylariomycetidae sp. FL2044]|nr:hypothetical protein F4778DRAFT_783982 [Xylariomycetidae sp. FL2044]
MWFNTFRTLTLICGISPVLAQTTLDPPLVDTTDTCVFTGTSKVYPASGCPFDCDPSGFCIEDRPITAPCGCTTVSLATATATQTGACATTSPCYNCQTGWGVVTVTESPCPMA